MNDTTCPTPAPAPATAPNAAQHRPFEDLQALLTGTLFVALGVLMFGQAGLLTGGTTGVAFLLHYSLGWHFGLTLFLVNVPFYVLAWLRMGWVFTLKTCAGVGLLSLWVTLLPRWIGFQNLSPVFAAVMGGLLIGVGILILFRHRGSLGGFNVLALFLQDRYGWRAGQVQMVLDSLVLLCALPLVALPLVLLSVLGALVLNQLLTTNHRKDRYVAM